MCSLESEILASEDVDLVVLSSFVELGESEMLISSDVETEYVYVGDALDVFEPMDLLCDTDIVSDGGIENDGEADTDTSEVAVGVAEVLELGDRLSDTVNEVEMSYVDDGERLKLGDVERE